MCFSGIVAADDSGRVPNSYERLGRVIGYFTKGYAAGRERLCRKARLKPLLIAVLAVVGFCMALQKAEAQPYEPFARNYWIHPVGVNYTLSTPVNNGTEWIMAAPMNEQTLEGTYTTNRRNVIAMFRVSYPYYSIISPQGLCEGDVRVIGMKGTGTEEFDRSVEFEVHCVVQDCSSDTVILCGSINRAEGEKTVGMVAVMDKDFNLISLRQYEHVRVFYSVYAQDGYYFVCGQMQDYAPYNSTAIALRDALAAPMLSTNPNMWAFHTNPTLFRDWAFHKIAVRNVDRYIYGCSPEFSVSAAGTTDENRGIGWAVFYMNTLTGSFSFGNAAYAIQTDYTPNSRVTIANIPRLTTMNTPLMPQGILLSVSDGSNIYTYEIDNNLSATINSAFRMDWNGRLQDMDCGRVTGTQHEVAWVGNREEEQIADYIRTNVTYPATAAPPPPGPYYHFIPSGTTLPNSYYSLHKVHYNERSLTFHAGGYYSEGIAEADRNRTTFAVTPERVPASNQCTQRDMMNFHPYPIVDAVDFGCERVRIGGVELPVNDRLYNFCTMECERTRGGGCGMPTNK